MYDLLLGHVDWEAMFVPKHALLDSVIRGTAVYLCLFLILRFLKNRSVGGVGMSDLLTVILVANALQEGLIGKGSSITEGVVSTLVVIGWSSGLDWLAFRFPGMGRVLRSKPVPLVRNGVAVPEGLRREMMTEEALRAQLRLSGVSGPEEVKSAFMEENGQVSVLKR
ncbi:MAG: DUF421 domain-containing protein [Oxalobacteraceae bacterium]|nr:MAG: DUF421 domain-containing protein [Oxalobacteraceae bacterium]